MNTDTLNSPSDALMLVNTTMFRLQNALSGPIASVVDAFPLKEGVNKANFENELAKFPNMTLSMVLHQGATREGPARDFCGKASIGYWAFEGLNPFKIFFPLYKQLLGG